MKDGDSLGILVSKGKRVWSENVYLLHCGKGIVKRSKIFKSLCKFRKR